MLPDSITIGAKQLNISYTEDLPGEQGIASRLDGDTIQISNAMPIDLQKHHLVMQLVYAIIRILSSDAKLTRTEVAFAHALFGIVSMNDGLLSCDGQIASIDMPGHTIKVVSGAKKAENEGEIDIACMEIRVREELSGYHRFEVLWHEVIHLIAWLINVDYKEWQICYLAFCLASMFTQNDFSWVNHDDTDR